MKSPPQAHLESRIEGVDLFRVFAAFAVICIHSRPFDGINTPLAVLVNQSVLLAQNTFRVPLFWAVAMTGCGLSVESAWSEKERCLRVSYVTSDSPSGPAGRPRHPRHCVSGAYVRDRLLWPPLRPAARAEARRCSGWLTSGLTA